ncbi:cell division protein DivIC [Melghiribacillus thermohalophilus]|uniref:Cell division protein DivIC n=1 Tax=Melghiribacillus thermohalophilus TaxID=1324956 RepID=A0A4R3MQS8_9BACI|nr:septum formation initiator family protein [Melghiribacillus thermohalophilus]TCT18169.1 cell division protein DivIC [Melghiribacillus thermohalophilus]
MGSRKQQIAKIQSRYMEQYNEYIDQRKQKKKFLYRRLALFAAVVLITFGSLMVYHLNQRELYKQKQEEYNELEARLEQLKSEEKHLKEEVQLLNDTDYLLQIARKDYFFSEEGEIIFKIPDEKPSY